MTEPRQALILAAEHADWTQVVLNGGPPCFHLEPERGRFCLRAQRWGGHRDNDHPFVSLADLIALTRGPMTEREAALRALVTKWRESAAWETDEGSREYGSGLDQCADELAAALALERRIVQRRSEANTPRSEVGPERRKWAERRAALAPPSDAEAPAEPLVWRCFHCDEVFTTCGSARDHFGANEGADLGCLIDRVALEVGGTPERGRGLLMALRKAEAERDEWQRRALAAEEKVESAEQYYAETMRLTKGHGVFMALDYLEGEKLAQAAQIRALTEAITCARFYVEVCTGAKGVTAGMAEQELARIDAALQGAVALAPTE